MKKLLILLLSITSLSVFAETYETRIKIGSTLENVFNASSPAVVVPPHSTFIETGAYGNIALIGTNGLTTSSYTASSKHSHSSYSVSAIFDGYMTELGTKINNESSGIIQGGSWASRRNDNPIFNEWISVNLGDFAHVGGFRLIALTATNGIKNVSKDIIIQASIDGIIWDDYYTTTAPFILDTDVLQLPIPVVT